MIFAKTPELGRVKTRLQPKISPEFALRLHRAFVADTLALAARAEVDRIVVAFSGDPEPGLVPAGIEIDRQAGSDLGERLEHATTKAFQGGAQRVVVIGTDSPDLPADRIPGAIDALEGSDVVLGPAGDGGYYLVALRAPQRGIFAGIDWGTDRVLEQTLRRAEELGLAAAELERWFDVDRPEDLVRLQDEIRRRRREAGTFPRQTARLLDLLGPMRC